MHRTVDPAPLNVQVRRHRGSRDFGAVLRKALDEGYAQLVASEQVRAAFGDTGLEAPAEAPADATPTDDAPHEG